MEISKKWKKRWVVIGIILILVGAWQWIYRYRYQQELVSCEKGVSTCLVYETNYLYIKTSGLWVYYRYSVDGKSYDSRCNLGLEYEDELKKELLNKNFPVAYCKKKPNISTALITPEQFKEYGYDFPLSLKWVEDFRKNKVTTE